MNSFYIQVIDEWGDGQTEEGVFDSDEEHREQLEITKRVEKGVWGSLNSSQMWLIESQDQEDLERILLWEWKRDDN